ncbi:MAG TPA: hypothetical protein VIL78_00710 [Hanamia sp.]
METPNPKKLTFSKTDKRLLVKYLEKYYITLLFAWNFHLRNSLHGANNTRKARLDRHYRLMVKPVELILHALGSQFMDNVKSVSIRETSTINAESSGLLQGKKTFPRNNGGI